MGETRLRLTSIVGARPQFIKAAPVSSVLHSSPYRDRVEEVMIHTGQHYDPAMSKGFFEELRIPEPAFNLGVGSGTHAWQTAEMMIRLEERFERIDPDGVLLYGDTNSTLAGALTAAKMHIPICHVEAGVRSGRMSMPEEVNRVLVDRISDLLLCPSPSAVENLAAEGITSGVSNVGDVMLDVWRSTPTAPIPSELVEVARSAYGLATIHRAENTDDPAILDALLGALGDLAEAGVPIILPLHPRTKQRIDGRALPEGVYFVDPQPYGVTKALLSSARVLLTDSGGMQKEAMWASVPCVTLRPETEWVETVQVGWNTVVGADPALIVEAALAPRPPLEPPAVYGDGAAAERVADAVLRWMEAGRAQVS